MSGREAEREVRAVVGRPAPDFELPEVAGSPWRLADHVGRPLLLVFHRHLQ